MKLLFCDNTIWGLMNFREEVFFHFYKQGHEIVLVAPTDELTQMKTTIPQYVKFVPVKLNRSTRNPLSNVEYLFHLWLIYRRERPDCIFHYTIKPNIYGCLVSHWLRIRCVAMIAGLGYAFSKQGLLGKIVRILYKVSLKYAYRVFVLNEENRDTLLSYHILTTDKIVLLKSGEGVNTHKIRKSQVQKENEKTTFLMVARLLYDKGYSEFVEASKLLHSKGVSANFCLLGPIDESNPNAVKKKILEADIKAGYIQYLGFSTFPLDVMGKSGSVIVLPSYYREGMNRSLMEACALGKPIITTNVSGCKELVDNGRNGFLIPPCDSKALANAMEQYLNLPLDIKNKMGNESRRIAESRFDVSHVILEYEKVLNG